MNSNFSVPQLSQNGRNSGGIMTKNISSYFSAVNRDEFIAQATEVATKPYILPRDLLVLKAFVRQHRGQAGGTRLSWASYCNTSLVRKRAPLHQQCSQKPKQHVLECARQRDLTSWTKVEYEHQHWLKAQTHFFFQTDEKVDIFETTRVVSLVEASRSLWKATWVVTLYDRAENAELT